MIPVPWGAVKINLESVNKMKRYESPFKNILILDKKNIQDFSVIPVPWGAMKINLESVNKMKG